MAAYEQENGIATKGGLNMLYHIYRVSQLPVFRGSLDVKKTGGVAADGTSANTGHRRGMFELLQQWVTRRGGRRILLNNCLGHRAALVMMSAANSVDFIRTKFQPTLEELFRFISNSAVRHKSMQAAFAGLGLDEVAILGAFFTRWLSHGRVLTNMHMGLAGMLAGLKQIAENKNDADCAKANGLHHQVGSFEFIATVELLFDLFEPIDIYKKQLQAREQTHAGNVAHYHVCVKAVEAMAADVKNCPALLLLIDQIKTRKISSEYVRELDGVDVDSPGALEDWLGGVLMRFDREIRTPFLSAVLRELHERVEDATMAALCAIDRVVLPVDVLDYPARVAEFKKQSMRAAKKRAKQDAAERARRVAEALAAAAAADDSGDCDSEESDRAKVRVNIPSLVLPQVAEMDLTESHVAAASFEQDAAAIGTAFDLSGEEVKQLRSEHAAWRSYLLDAQQELVAAGSNFLLKTVLDLTKCRIFRVNQRSTRAAFPMHVLLMNTTATNLEVSVEPERGFSFMNATKTMARNNLLEKTLNNLMVVGLHSPSVLGASTDVGAQRELQEFVDACMSRWDSIKARRCRSAAYNDDKDKAPVVSARKKRSRQETLEASSFTVLAAIKEKAAAEEGEEGVEGDGKAFLTTTATVPFKVKQAKLADFFVTSTKAAAAKEDAHKEKVKAARKGKKRSKKDKPTTSKVIAEARWLDESERQDDQLNKEGKVVSVVPGRKGRTGSPGRKRKQITSTTAR